LLFAYAIPTIQGMNTNTLNTITTSRASYLSFSIGGNHVECQIYTYGEPSFRVSLSNSLTSTEYSFPVAKAMSVTGFVLKNSEDITALRDALQTFASEVKYNTHAKDEKSITLVS